MKRITCGLCFDLMTCVLTPAALVQGAESVSIRYDQSDPRVAFAVGDLHAALTEAGCQVVPSDADWTITLDTFQRGMGPQSFRIRREGERSIRDVGLGLLGELPRYPSS